MGFPNGLSPRHVRCRFTGYLHLWAVPTPRRGSQGQRVSGGTRSVCTAARATAGTAEGTTFGWRQRGARSRGVGTRGRNPWGQALVGADPGGAGPGGGRPGWSRPRWGQTRVEQAQVGAGPGGAGWFPRDGYHRGRGGRVWAPRTEGQGLSVARVTLACPSSPPPLRARGQRLQANWGDGPVEPQRSAHTSAVVCVCVCVCV